MVNQTLEDLISELASIRTLKKLVIIFKSAGATSTAMVVLGINSKNESTGGYFSITKLESNFLLLVKLLGKDTSKGIPINEFRCFSILIIWVAVIVERIMD